MTRLRTAIFLALTLGAVEVFAAPTISVDNPMYETSIAAAGVVVRHVFNVTNTGDQTLRITDAQPSCACTTAVPMKAEIEPGKSIAISVAVDTSGFAGLVARTVSIESNDPANPRLMLIVSITNPAQTQNTLPTINALDFQKRFYVLVDVRTPEEFAAGHLLGAVNIPLSELQNNMATWAPRLPKDVPIILQCKIGARSARATQLLIKAGFGNVLNLDGGIMSWASTFGDRYLFGF